MVQARTPLFNSLRSRTPDLEASGRKTSAPLSHLLEPALDHVAPQGGEAVDEEEAVAVVRLVEEAAGGEPLGLLLEDLPAHVLRAQTDAPRALERGVHLADREAALLALLLAFGRDDFGVGGDQPEPL